MSRRITPEDIYRIQQPGECRLSPCGKRLAVVVARSEKETLRSISSIWMVPTAGGEPRQFTHATRSDSSPRFSPDGRTLAFLSNRSEKSEIWTMPTDGGEAQPTDEARRLDLRIRVLPQRQEARDRLHVRRIRMRRNARRRRSAGMPGQDAPKVRTIERTLLQARRRRLHPQGAPHLWIVDVETGKARQLTDDDRYDESHPSWSPDGRWIYFNSNRIRESRTSTSSATSSGGSAARGGEIENVSAPSTDRRRPSRSAPTGSGSRSSATTTPTRRGTRKHTKLWLVRRGGRPVELAADLDRGCDELDHQRHLRHGIDAAARLVARTASGSTSSSAARGTPRSGGATSGERKPTPVDHSARA